MLFRTERSADWALQYWGRWNALLDPILERASSAKNGPAALAGFAMLASYVLVTGVVGIGLRVTSTVYGAIRNPLYTVREAPRNWFRQTLCTDFAHVPEIVPMEALKGDATKLFMFVRFIACRPERISVKVLTYVLLSPLLIGYVASAVYRLSFKATALAYAPFIWAAHATTGSPLSLKIHLQRITKGELEKARRWYSGIVLAAAAAKAGFALGLVERQSLVERFPTVRAAEYFLVPGGLPWWQLTLVGDAVLTVLLLWFADAALARHESEHPWGERTVRNVTEATSFVRGILGILTAAYLFWLALHLSLHG
jgi:hypothetical protein